MQDPNKAERVKQQRDSFRTHAEEMAQERRDQLAREAELRRLQDEHEAQLLRMAANATETQEQARKRALREAADYNRRMVRYTLCNSCLTYI